MFDTFDRSALQIAFGDRGSWTEKVVACWDFFYCPYTGICVSSFNGARARSLPMPLYVGAMFLKYVLCLLGSLPCLFLMLLSFGVHSQPPRDQIKLFEILKYVPDFLIFLPFYLLGVCWLVVPVFFPFLFLLLLYPIIVWNVLVGCILVMDIWNSEQDSFTDRVNSLVCLVFGEDFGYADDDDAAKGILDYLLFPGLLYQGRRLFNPLALLYEPIRILLGIGVFLAVLPLMSLSYGVTLGKNALRKFLCPSFFRYDETLFRWAGGVHSIFSNASDDDTYTVFDAGSTDDLRRSDGSGSATDSGTTEERFPSYVEAVKPPPSYTLLPFAPPPYTV